MKSVIIYSMMNPFNKNRRIHYGMLEKFKKLCDECNIYTVSHDIEKPGKKKINEIYKKHKPDVFITYDGRIQERKNNIGPSILKDVPCKKISICNDIPGKKAREDTRFFMKNGIDLIFQRGTYIEKVDIPSVWLPYSADENIFAQNKKIKKITNRVGIAATYNPKAYAQRRKIMKILGKNNLLKLCDKPCKKIPEEYINFLISLNVGVTCTKSRIPELTTPHAKVFEYMASKTAVLTPSFIGIDNLFTKEYNKYIEVFNMNNLVKKAKKLLNNDKYRNEMVNNAYNLFLEHHTDAKRAKEMYDNVLNLLENREIVRKWDR